MATKLFLRTATESGISIASLTEYQLSSTAGSSDTLWATTSTVASGNHIIVTDVSTSSSIFLMRVNAVTISGTITSNLWMFESVMSANAQSALVVSRYTNDGSFVSDVVANGNANHTFGTELGTSAAAQNWTITPTSTSFNAGDWLAVVVHADAGGGTMASGVVSLRLNGPTGGASGDSWVQFTETIVPFSGVVPRHPGVNFQNPGIL